MSSTIDLETRSAFRCTDGCDITEDEPQGGQYECDNDGNFSGGQALNEGRSKKHQCPTCGKFGSKQADLGCDECGAEVEAIEAFVCPSCEELFETEAEAREHCSEDAVAGREADAARRERERTEVRVEVRPNFPGSNSITFCDRDAKVLSDVPDYRVYLMPTGSFPSVTECVEHPVCETAARTGRLCDRHKGPLGFAEIMHPTESHSIRQGAPDGPCGDRPYIYISMASGGFVEPEVAELPERVKSWLDDRKKQNEALAAEIGSLDPPIIPKEIPHP